MAAKKELKEAYKNLKPDIGIFKIESRTSGNCYLFTSRDLRSKMNRIQFQLNANSHPHQDLQDAWREQGADNFNIEVLERLKYDSDDKRSNFDQDLELLQLIWEEKLSSRIL